MNTVERAAIGLYDHLAAMPGSRQNDIPWRHASEDLKNRLREQARVILETVSDRLIPDPKSTMLQAAVSALVDALPSKKGEAIDPNLVTRSVISALRDPNVETMDDVHNKLEADGMYPTRAVTSHIFNAIIDAILKEPL